MIEKLLSPEVQKYIKDHQNDDPFLLALKSKPKDPDFPFKAVLDQILAKQKGKQGIIDLQVQARPLFDAFWQKSLSENPIDTPERRAKFEKIKRKASEQESTIIAKP